MTRRGCLRLWAVTKTAPGGVLSWMMMNLLFSLRAERMREDAPGVFFLFSLTAETMNDKT